MTSRERFRETMRRGVPDRVPLFDDGVRDEVLAAWRQQGLAPGADLHTLFGLDRREEIMPDFEPHPRPERWPASRAELDLLGRSLDPLDPVRLPGDWPQRVQAWAASDTVRVLRVHRGFFLSLGVGDWQRFHQVACLVADQPELVREMLLITGGFAARLADRILREVEVDAAIFSEPIGGNDRPLISPEAYRELVLPSYDPVLAVLARRGVRTVIFRTYGNVRPLLPAILERGLNCLWVSEASNPAMDYRRLRREFGPALGLIGGISMDALRRDRRAIRREIGRKVPSLLAQGGYVPMAAGRVREDVPFANYAYYRHRLAQVTCASRP
jgi:hypothetical protein